MLGMNVYVSEGRREAVLALLRTAASSISGVACVSRFVDKEYNRSSYTLLSHSISKLSAAATAIAASAVEAIDMRLHSASHPRLGTIDHISCHDFYPAALNTSTPSTLSASTSSLLQQAPSTTSAGTLSYSSSGNAAELAHAVASALGERVRIPCLLYGAADKESRQTLAQVRRTVGYFSGSGRGEWQGLPSALLCAGEKAGGNVERVFAYGPGEVDAAVGIACVGAVPWVVNFNVQVYADDMAAVRRIAVLVSKRGGGLPNVEAMALLHSPGIIEVACNLLDAASTPPAAVEEMVRRVAHKEGLEVGESYTINPPPATLVALAETALRPL